MCPEPRSAVFSYNTASSPNFGRIGIIVRGEWQASIACNYVCITGGNAEDINCLWGMGRRVGEEKRSSGVHVTLPTTLWLAG